MLLISRDILVTILHLILKLRNEICYILIMPHKCVDAWSASKFKI